MSHANVLRVPSLHKHGLGWYTPRSGRQMQHGPKYRRLKAEADAYAQRWDRLQAEAEINGEIKRLIYACLRDGREPREIVDAFDRDADGTVAELRRRKAAIDAAGG